MGKPTGFYVDAVRFLGRGSDYFGPCETCGKAMPEAAVFSRYQIYRHAEGFFYLAGETPGRYQHMGCAINYEGKKIIDTRTLKARGSLKELPGYAFKAILIDAGFSEAGADDVLRSVAA